MAKLTLDLHISERDALIVLAERERRNPRDQAALIIRRELEREGLIQPVNVTAQASETQHDAR